MFIILNIDAKNCSFIYSTPGKLQQFIDDLHSGKLHREYHNGPDPTEPPQIEVHEEVCPLILPNPLAFLPFYVL